MPDGLPEFAGFKSNSDERTAFSLTFKKYGFTSFPLSEAAHYVTSALGGGDLEDLFMRRAAGGGWEDGLAGVAEETPSLQRRDAVYTKYEKKKE